MSELQKLCDGYKSEVRFRDDANVKEKYIKDVLSLPTHLDMHAECKQMFLCFE